MKENLKQKKKKKNTLKSVRLRSRAVAEVSYCKVQVLSACESKQETLQLLTACGHINHLGFHHITMFVAAKAGGLGGQPCDFKGGLPSNQI
jgi:hypothetical protein